MTLEYTGLSLDEVRADNFRDRVFHPEDIQRLREARHKGLSGTIPFENEQRALGKDGKYRWFLVRYNPLLDERGNVLRWFKAPTTSGPGAPMARPTLNKTFCAVARAAVGYASDSSAPTPAM